MVSHRECLEEFTRRLAEAAPRSGSRPALAQAVVDAAAECVGATSAAGYERSPDGQLHRTAVTGLFPPLVPLENTVVGKLATRVRLIEHVLRAGEMITFDSPAGRVAESGRGELIVDASADARIPSHDDPALSVRSIIFAPLMLRGESRGVLVFVNPVNGRSFTSEDLVLAESVAGLAATALKAV